MTLGNLLGRIVTSRLGHTVSTLVPSTTIWEREWDVCCVLDGCRYDLMADVATVGHELLPPPEGLESLWSAGSQSAEWMDNTFASIYDSEMQNTAYVTGNPFTAQSCDHIVVTSGEVLPLSGDEFGLLYEAWRDEWVDGDISTIPPGPLTEAAISIWNHREEFDVDRVLVHYMQPHAPFRSRPEWFLGTADRGGWGRVDGESEDTDLTDLSPEEIRALEELAAAETDGMKDPWTRLRDGDLPREEFWAAYRDNLRWVLDDITRLFENCDGRIALTSDHGNGAGEFGVWSHPPGTPVPSLRRVPWVVRRGTNESTCTPELPDGVARGRSPDGAGDEVEGRLAALGYR
ncbi:MAG: hypothetical protein ACLFNI_07505 [Natronomonas sp.]